jgi:hypothetical protein
VCIVPIVVTIFLQRKIYIFSLVIKQDNKEEEEIEKDEVLRMIYLENYGELYEDLRFYERMALMYNPIFMFRRLIFSFMVVFFSDFACF